MLYHVTMVFFVHLALFSHMNIDGIGFLMFENIYKDSSIMFVSYLVATI